jgi:uroporphyrin-3 C-methyltransferase
MWLALAAGLMVLAGGAMWWLAGRYRAIENESEQQHAVLVERLGQLAGSLARLDEAGRSRAGTEQRVNDRLEQLEQAVKGLFDGRGGSEPLAIMAEIEYLLVVAIQRLQIEGDVGTALAALEAADERLRDAGHPDLMPLREALIADINALEEVAAPDIEGQALYLAGLIGRIEELPLKRVEFDPAARAQEQPRSIWAQMWADFVDLVDIERLDVPDTVLVDPAGRRALLDGIRLELTTARSAVLRRDTGNMEASLAIVVELLSRYFERQDPAVATMIDTLRRMQQVELTPAVPDLSRSLEAVRAARASQ